MATRSHHSARLAAPLLWTAGVLVAVISLVEGVWELAQGAARPSSPFLATLGDGLDMFALKLEGVPQFFASFGGAHSSNLTIAAVFTSLVSCAIALRQVSVWIRRPGDVASASRYAAHRTKRMLASTDHYEHWGHVVAAGDQSPISFAAVHLLDSRGSTVARTTSDSEGRFGFSAPRESFLAAGESVALFVRKAGWAHTETMEDGQVAVMTAVGPSTATAPVSNATRALGRLAFWGQVAVVPLAFSLHGGPLLTAALVSLPLCALVYAIGKRSTVRVGIAGKPLIVAVAAMLFVVLGATAGSLTPSALPASTMHSLSEVYASIASSAFDSSAITANQNGSLIAQLKYMNNQLAWASSSTDIWSLNSGNVGIGTTTPTTKLDVGGNINASGSFRLNGPTVIRAPGTDNLLVGIGAAGASISTGFGNVTLGKDAGKSLTTGAVNVYIGWLAGATATSSNHNVFIGANAGQLNTSGGSNVFIGRQSGNNNTTGDSNTFIGGFNAGVSNTIGSSNTFLGWKAGAGNVNGNDNVAMGYQAGNGLGGDSSGNILIGKFVGNEALSSKHFNTWIGTEAGRSASGRESVFLGYSSGYSRLVGTANMGGYNTFLGTGTTGSIANITGAIAIGYGAMPVASHSAVFGSGLASGSITDLYFGQGVATISAAGITLHATGGQGADNPGAPLRLAGGRGTGTGAGGSIILQTTAASGSASVLNTLVDRMTIVANGNVGIGVSNPGKFVHIASTASDGDVLRLQDSDGTCDHNPEAGAETVTCSSDARLKSDIVDAPPILASLMGLHIRQYTVNASGDRMTGVVAQEVQTTWPELVSSSSTGYLMVQQPTTWQLLKGIQEQQAEIEALRSGFARSSASLDLASSQWLQWDFRNLFSSILDAFTTLMGVTFERGGVQAERIKAKTVELEGDDGQAYCVRVVGGQLQSTSGSCGQQAVAISTPEPSASPTPELTPSDLPLAPIAST